MNVFVELGRQASPAAWYEGLPWEGIERIIYFEASLLVSSVRARRASEELPAFKQKATTARSCLRNHGTRPVSGSDRNGLKRLRTL